MNTSIYGDFKICISVPLRYFFNKRNDIRLMMVIVSKVSQGKLRFLSKTATSCHSQCVPSPSSSILQSIPSPSSHHLPKPSHCLPPLTSPPPSRRETEYIVLNILTHSIKTIAILYTHWLFSNFYFSPILVLLNY